MNTTIDAKKVINEAKFHRDMARDYASQARTLDKKGELTDVENKLYSFAISQVVKHKQLSRKVLRNG